MTGSDGSQEPRKLRGKELAAHLEAQRRERVRRQRAIRGSAPFGAGAPAAMPGPIRERSRGRPPASTGVGANPASGPTAGRGQYSDLGGDEPRVGRRRPLITWSSRVAVVLLLVLVVIGVVKSQASSRLDTSCTKAGFSLATDSALEGGKLVYKLTGPAGQYQLVATGADGAVHELTAELRLSGCKIVGAAAVTLPAGTYTVTLRSPAGVTSAATPRPFSVVGS